MTIVVRVFGVLLIIGIIASVWYYYKINDSGNPLFRGAQLVKREQYKEAIPVLTEAVKDFPGDARVFYFRGVAYYKLGDYKKALQDFSSGIVIDSTDKDLYFQRAITNIKLEQQSSVCNDLLKSKNLGSKEAEEAYNRLCLKR